jgi:hypothetical protein
MALGSNFSLNCKHKFNFLAVGQQKNTYLPFLRQLYTTLGMYCNLKGTTKLLPVKHHPYRHDIRQPDLNE